MANLIGRLMRKPLTWVVPCKILPSYAGLLSSDIVTRTHRANQEARMVELGQPLLRGTITGYDENRLAAAIAHRYELSEPLVRQAVLDRLKGQGAAITQSALNSNGDFQIQDPLARRRLQLRFHTLARGMDAFEIKKRGTNWEGNLALEVKSLLQEENPRGELFDILQATSGKTVNAEIFEWALKNLRAPNNDFIDSLRQRIEDINRLYGRKPSLIRRLFGGDSQFLPALKLSEAMACFLGPIQNQYRHLLEDSALFLQETREFSQIEDENWRSFESAAETGLRRFLSARNPSLRPSHQELIIREALGLLGNVRRAARLTGIGMEAFALKCTGQIKSLFSDERTHRTLTGRDGFYEPIRHSYAQRRLHDFAPLFPGQDEAAYGEMAKKLEKLIDDFMFLAMGDYCEGFHYAAGKEIPELCERVLLNGEDLTYCQETSKRMRGKTFIVEKRKNIVKDPQLAGLLAQIADKAAWRQAFRVLVEKRAGIFNDQMYHFLEMRRYLTGREMDVRVFTPLAKRFLNIFQEAPTVQDALNGITSNAVALEAMLWDPSNKAKSVNVFGTFKETIRQIIEADWG